ncbi:hypothetical protein KIL84_012061 [Mauremys mutica]|uniref:Uncharacterized protein n=1 Tax=Mauremys mutica TaxID=74926 RepID=A0A9D3XAW2_9SAUR|nr:hypothetical protein KIL84_012061 [Mauremys mutica]
MEEEYTSNELPEVWKTEFTKQHPIIPVEKCAFVTIILSIITAVAGTIYYSLEFALIRSPQSPFPHDISDSERLARAYRVDSAELGLAAFELGVSVWILCLLQQARKTLRQ